jgi:hypothetical protein
MAVRIRGNAPSLLKLFMQIVAKPRYAAVAFLVRHSEVIMALLHLPKAAVSALAFR